MIWSFFGKIHDSISALFAPGRSHSHALSKEVPGDVMEGHFAVLANMGEETKRFVVELHYLTEPALLELLERAKEEYGFKQKGALMIPCHPQELEKILEECRDGSAGHGGKLIDSIPML